MAEQFIFERLDALFALEHRVYPRVLPQNVAYPAVVYQRLSTERMSAFGRDVTQVETIMQVDVYGARSQGASAFATVATEVRRAVQRQRGVAGTVTVSDTFIDGERDDYEDETNLYRKSYDIRVWYGET